MICYNVNYCYIILYYITILFYFIILYIQDDSGAALRVRSAVAAREEGGIATAPSVEIAGGYGAKLRALWEVSGVTTCLTLLV